MPKKQTFQIDGSNFNSLKTFGKEIKLVFGIGDEIRMNNLNVVHDVLYGGYGLLDYQEEITLIWLNFKKSQHKQKYDDLKTLVEMFSEIEHIELILD